MISLSTEVGLGADTGKRSKTKLRRSGNAHMDFLVTCRESRSFRQRLNTAQISRINTDRSECKESRSCHIPFHAHKHTHHIVLPLISFAVRKPCGSTCAGCLTACALNENATATKQRSSFRQDMHYRVTCRRPFLTPHPRKIVAGLDTSPRGPTDSPRAAKT